MSQPNTLYQGVQPISIASTEGQKLVIGTHVSNMRVTVAARYKAVRYKKNIDEKLALCRAATVPTNSVKSGQSSTANPLTRSATESLAILPMLITTTHTLNSPYVIILQSMTATPRFARNFSDISALQ